MTAEPDSISLRLRPEKIEMGAFYNGARVRIEGIAPASSGVLVIVRGAEKDEICNRKARVGPIWLNTDRIHLSGAPCLFLSFSSDDVNSLLDRAVLDEYQLDEAAIKQRMSCRIHCKCPATVTQASSAHVPCGGVVPDANYGALLVSTYLALKVPDGRYQTFPKAVRIADSEKVSTRYSLDVLWPRKAPPGSYRVEVYACRNHAVVARSTAALEVTKVGFPARMASLAEGRPWVYGILAVVTAVLAGFGIDAAAVRLRRSKQRVRPQPEQVSPQVQPPAAVDASSAEVSEEEYAHHRWNRRPA